MDDSVIHVDFVWKAEAPFRSLQGGRQNAHLSMCLDWSRLGLGRHAGTSLGMMIKKVKNVALQNILSLHSYTAYTSKMLISRYFTLPSLCFQFGEVSLKIIGTIPSEATSTEELIKGGSSSSSSSLSSTGTA